MTIEHLQIAIEDCNQGSVTFNLGSDYSFLLGKKWYPLRGVLNHAAFLANERPNLNTYKALMQLTNLGLYTKIDKITFLNHLPVNLTEVQVLGEVKQLSRILFELTN